MGVFENMLNNYLVFIFYKLSVYIFNYLYRISQTLCLLGWSYGLVNLGILA